MTAREPILAGIQTGLGRPTAEPPSPPPVRLRIPEIARDRRIDSMLKQVARWVL